MNKRSFFVVGKHAVIEALKNPNRKVLRLFLTEESKKKIHRENEKTNIIVNMLYAMILFKLNALLFNAKKIGITNPKTLFDAMINAFSKVNDKGIIFLIKFNKVIQKVYFL